MSMCIFCLAETSCSLKKHSDKACSNAGETANGDAEKVQGEMVPEDHIARLCCTCSWAKVSDGRVPNVAFAANGVAKRGRRRLLSCVGWLKLASYSSVAEAVFLFFARAISTPTDEDRATGTTCALLSSFLSSRRTALLRKSWQSRLLGLYLARFAERTS